MTGDGTFQIRKGDYRKRLIEFLEHELNFHPKLVSFIRDNIRYIEIGLVIFVIVLISWTSWDYYHHLRMVNSSNALTKARAIDDDAARKEEMKTVAAEYSGTASGTWAALYLAHDIFARGDFETAVKSYRNILDQLGSDNPARLPVTYRLALALENSGKTAEALNTYRGLAAAKGFAYLGNLAAGRLLETKGDKGAALAAYRAALAAVPARGSEHDFLTVKIAGLAKVTAVKVEKEKTAVAGKGASAGLSID